MLRLVPALLCLLLLLAGCETTTNRNRRNALDWEDATEIGSVTPSPATIPTLPTPAPVAPSNTTATAPAPVPQPAETWIPLQRWSRLNVPVALSRVTPALAPTYTLRSTNGVFTLSQGSQVAHWEGLEVRLGFAPHLIDGQPYVHALDLKKTIQPLLLGAPCLGLNPHPVLVIDPGHGGENAGAKSIAGNRYEKEFTLDWALRLQALLASNHWQVFLTRSNDVDLALSNRVAFAADHKADLFLSLHFNSAAPNETQVGLETYCLTPAGMPSSLTRGFADEADTAFPNNGFDEQNLLLALRVHRALLQINGHHDRGVRRARFPGVLRGQQRPAILVEGGYLSNPHEAHLIGDPAYRQKLAEAVAGAMAGAQESQTGQEGQRAEAGRPSVTP